MYRKQVEIQEIDFNSCKGFLWLKQYIQPNIVYYIKLTAMLLKVWIITLSCL